MHRTERQEDKIKAAFERTVSLLTARPAAGQGTAETRVHTQGGYACEITDGKWTLVSDQSEKSGGEGLGPDPGVFLRAALGSCLAMGYVRWAAHLGVPLTSVEVVVQAGYDARGQYGVADVPPGYEAVRYVVTVESDAGEEDVLRVLDAADAHSPYHDVFERPVKLHREVHLTPPVLQ